MLRTTTTKTIASAGGILHHVPLGRCHHTAAKSAATALVQQGMIGTRTTKPITTTASWTWTRRMAQQPQLQRRCLISPSSSSSSFSRYTQTQPSIAATMVNARPSYGSTSFFSTSSLSSTLTSDAESWTEVWDKLSPDTQRLANEMLKTMEEEEEIAQEVREGKRPLPWKLRVALAKAITLAESRHVEKQHQAALLLTHLLNNEVALARRKNSFRLGIAGAPGAGKSTFIEAFGNYLLNMSNPNENNAQDSGEEATKKDKKSNIDLWKPEKMAVVAIDPSGKAGGSILGDKTRMQELSRHPRAFIRPAPAAGALGGLATFTDDVVSLCQVANYELVIVETVGLGQSEVEVEQCVDMLLLLVPPAGGDDLQGVKKGIVEVCDMLLVTKADGNLLPAAKRTAGDYKGAMQFIRTYSAAKTPLVGWQQPKVKLISSVTKDGFDKVWKEVCDYRQQAIDTGFLEHKRREQRKYWMWKNLQNLVQIETDSHPDLQVKAKYLEDELRSGRMTSRVAAAELLDCLRRLR